MAKRKHISWKTKYASALLALGHIPYDDAKQMTEDQIISLYHVDHNILHETGDENRDRYWNLEPRLIRAHRIKTKADAKIIAKGKRIRRRRMSPEAHALLEAGFHAMFPAKRKITSRGFDKTLRKKLDGTVVKR